MDKPIASLTIQHSAGPIRWMPSGSPHRALIDRAIVVATGDGISQLDGSVTTPWLDISVRHIAFGDPVIAGLSDRFHALRPLADGGLWEGLLTSITGQAVSLHSAAAFQRRLCAMLSPEQPLGRRAFRALPSAGLVAECSVEQVRTIGLTTKRAQGLIDVAQQVIAGNVTAPPESDIDLWMRELTRLPMVGPWTAASALLWGVGHPDVYPSGDVALLRAARFAYKVPGMSMRDLALLSESWRPQRAIAARLLWTNLLGMGWDDE